MSVNPNKPREFDAVFGGQVAPHSNAVVLGGIEGVKIRLNSSSEQAQLSALREALKYGEVGLDLVIQSLDSKSIQLKRAAYNILKNNQLATKIKKQLINRRYEFFACLRTLNGHASKVNSICLTLDGSTLYSGAQDSSINAWNWRVGKFKRICKPKPLDYSFPPIFLQASPDGQEIVIGYRGQAIETRTIMDARRIIRTGAGIHNSFAITRNGKTIFTDCSSGKHRIVACDFRSGKTKYHLPEDSYPIFALAISLDGKTLFNGNANFKINIWDIQTAKIARTLSGHSFLVTALCLSRDGNTLFSGSGDYTIKIWDWRQGELKSTLTGHSYGVNSIVLSPDGLTLFSASNDKTIKIWNWQTGELINTLEGHLGNVSSIAISPDGDYLFSASHDNTIKVWGLEYFFNNL